MEVTLRPATPADAETITRSYFAAWCNNLADLFGDGVVAASDPLARLPVFEEWLDPASDMSTTVAVLDDRHAGHASVSGDELVHLFIDPGAQGSGVGSALLTHAEETIAAAGHGQARLYTLVGNDAAVAFYTARGWYETDVRKSGTYFDTPMLEQLLLKDLE